MLNLELFQHSIKKTFNVKDRATRKEFWTFQIITSILSTIVMILLFKFSFNSFDAIIVNSNNNKEMMDNSFSVGVFMLLYFGFVSISNFTLGMRRLNDIEKNKFLILLVLTPFIGVFFFYFIGCLPTKNQDSDDDKEIKKELIAELAEKNKTKGNNNFIEIK